MMSPHIPPGTGRMQLQGWSRRQSRDPRAPSQQSGAQPPAPSVSGGAGAPAHQYAVAVPSPVSPSGRHGPADMVRRAGGRHVEGSCVGMNWHSDFSGWAQLLEGKRCKRTQRHVQRDSLCPGGLPVAQPSHRRPLPSSALPQSVQCPKEAKETCGGRGAPETSFLGCLL